MSFLLIITTAGFLLSPASVVGHQLKALFRPYQTDSCAERQTPGLICYSCSVVATCVRINDEWQTIPVAECDNDEGMYCNIRQGGCSDLAGPCNSVGHKQNFVCSSVGIFPDPYDCQKYHFCQQSGNSLGAINVECGGNSAFNPENGQCSLNLNSDVCLEDQYQCERVGQQAAWPGNSNIFYVCKLEVTGNTSHLYPALYRCGPEETFNGTICVRGEEAAGTTVGPPTGIPTYDCPAFGLYPIAWDCHSYYFCNNDLMPVVYHCPENTYFNATFLSCMRGSCPTAAE